MNVIIVESKNDKAFILAIVNYLNLDNTTVDPPILIDDDDYILLKGSDSNPAKPSLLTRKIKEIKTDLIKKGIQNIGILLDLDSNTPEEKMSYINNAVRNAFSDDRFTFSDIQSTDTKYPLEYQNETINLICHFTNFNEQGELETVLKEIAAKDSTYADCLESWRDCIEEKGKSITKKDFDKYWVSNYLRFDTCTPKEQKQAGRKCSFSAFDYVMKHKSEIFNLESEHLNDIRSFLELFRTNNGR